VAAQIEARGWRIGQSQRIPHDLWAAGELPGSPLTEQLTLLLAGFDLTFEVQAMSRTIDIVALDASVVERLAGVKPQAADSAYRSSPPLGETTAGTRQVYTLRVAEQPVRAVLDELTKRLGWQIEINKVAIETAGRSLDERISFAVKNVERDELLDAILRPAQLSFRREGERIVIIPRD
jgi:hypothetical protein